MVESLVCALVLPALVAPGRAADLSPALAERYSVASPAIAAGPTFTLLDPAWMLPPIEALDAEAEAHRGSEQTALELEAGASGDAAAGRGRAAEPASYALSDHLSAQLRYERSRLFGTASSGMLRDDSLPTFSNRPDRDVVGLNMAWRLAGGTVGLAYQLESARSNTLGADSGLARFLPGSEQATHSLSLGVTRAWGAPAPAPVRLDVPLMPPDGGSAAPTPAAVGRGSGAP